MSPTQTPFDTPELASVPHETPIEVPQEDPCTYRLPRTRSMAGRINLCRVRAPGSGYYSRGIPVAAAPMSVPLRGSMKFASRTPSLRQRPLLLRLQRSSRRGVFTARCQRRNTRYHRDRNYLTCKIAATVLIDLRSAKSSRRKKRSVNHNCHRYRKHYFWGWCAKVRRRSESPSTRHRTHHKRSAVEFIIGRGEAM